MPCGIASSMVCCELGAMSMTRRSPPVEITTRFGFGPVSRIAVSFSMRSERDTSTPATSASVWMRARSRMSALDSPLTQNASPSRLKTLSSMKYASIGGVPPSGWRNRVGEPVLIGRSLTIVNSVGSQRNRPVLACSDGLRVA